MKNLLKTLSIVLAIIWAAGLTGCAALNDKLIETNVNNAKAEWVGVQDQEAFRWFIIPPGEAEGWKFGGTGFVKPGLSVPGGDHRKFKELRSLRKDYVWMKSFVRDILKSPGDTYVSVESDDYMQTYYAGAKARGSKVSLYQGTIAEGVWLWLTGKRGQDMAMKGDSMRFDGPVAIEWGKDGRMRSALIRGWSREKLMGTSDYHHVFLIAGKDTMERMDQAVPRDLLLRTYLHDLSL